jgi:hypothetical protein
MTLTSRALPRPLYYDRQGKPIELEDWVKKFEDPAYKILVKTDLPDGRHVSTVWLGVDHGYGWLTGSGRLLIFETMVFPGNDCQRYATEAEALAGHEEMVRELMKGAVS